MLPTLANTASWNTGVRNRLFPTLEKPLTVSERLPDPKSGSASTRPCENTPPRRRRYNIGFLRAFGYRTAGSVAFGVRLRDQICAASAISAGKHSSV